MFIKGKFSEDFEIERDCSVTNNQDYTVDEILEALDELSKLWTEGSDFYIKAKELLIKENSMSEADIATTLSYIPELFNSKNLKKRIISEFGSKEVLDKYSHLKNQSVKIKAQALGTVLHVTAGNVFLGVIDSMVMGLITKNYNIIKLSSSNTSFPKLFCESLLKLTRKEVICDMLSFVCWRGGNKEFEKEICKNVDAVMIWGGEETVTSYRSYLSLGQKLIDYGPKLSFGVVYKDYLDFKGQGVFKSIVKDFVTWRQSACSNAQTYFIEDTIDKKLFLQSLEKSLLETQNIELNLSANQQVERLKEKERLLFSHYKTNIESIFNDDFILHFKGDDQLSLSILNQTLNINTFKNTEDLILKIADKKSYLQTCAVGTLNRENIVSKLSRSGIKRFTNIGAMTQGHDGAPHDGRFALRELVNFINDEGDDFEEKVFNLKDKTPIFSKNKDRIIKSKDLVEHKITKSNELINIEREPGLYFTSGGSTGEPKYVDYSYADFDKVTDLISENFISLGLNSNCVVANLFMSGNMWSSFLSTFKVLEKVGCTQLPIGGSLTPEDTLKYILDFKANVIIGVPTKILSIAKLVEESDTSVDLDYIFFAGERFSEDNYDYLNKVFSCDKIYSAGYAGVDSGLIGVQSLSGKRGEHTLIEGVKIHSLGETNVISSILRSNMPVINYELQDKLRFSKDFNSEFILDGRVDSVIQLWGCRFSYEDILRCLDNVKKVQVIITKDEKMTIITDGKAIDVEKISNIFVSYIDDVRNTVDFEFLKNRLSSKANEFVVNKKTGKTQAVIDERF